ncbi:NADH-quinone oxidoreductase subunit A [Flavobacterium cellulosilyticum]|uniref:NADH-quinone oxidoreductase subunit A n=1 Tax=Flavobacterium cellulosilyticum TaxID=2541731 RepID=A0A4R5CEI6_9FLAO|nr:NADH-quinone oxidoreductase subunit A [Flavobacterium cellulosilyticum]TDD98461.1 NADH-quinone oxidoreductase subunit A [Flavobacterium cellulosilyticum]
MGSEAIIVFLLAGIVLVAGANFLSDLISPKSDNLQKREPYESGMTTIGPTWVQFKVGYYLYAILFLVFDVEVAFLIPWALVFKEIGIVAFYEIIIFLIILGLGLAYAWKKEALKWE